MGNEPTKIFARYLNQTGKKEKALSKLEEIMDEYDHMERYEKRLKKDIYRSARSLHEEIKKEDKA